MAPPHLVRCEDAFTDRARGAHIRKRRGQEETGERRLLRGLRWCKQRAVLKQRENGVAWRGPYVSIIVSSSPHTRPDEIARALLAQTIPIAGHEIVIVDGVRSLTVRRRVAQTAADLEGRLDVRIIENDQPGRARDLNLGARAARHDHLLFLADDFVPGPTWLAAHLKLHASRPEPTVVGLGPTRLDERVRRKALCRWLEDTGRIYAVTFAESDSLPRGFFYGGNTSMKRSLWRAAGGFDEVFPYDTTDDYEFGVRLHRLGMQVVYLKDAATRHLHWITLGYRCRQMRKAGESAALLRARHPGEAALPADCDADAATHLRRALGAFLRRLSCRRRDARERFWQNLLAASFVFGFERKRRRLTDGEDKLPPPPEQTLADVPEIEALLGGQADRTWVSGQTAANIGGLEPVDVWDGCGERGRVDGSECMVFRNPAGSAQAYFSIERCHGFAGRAVEVEVEIFADAEGDAIRVEYDSSDLSVSIPPHLPGAFKATPWQALGATGDWQRLRFTIEDGRFCRSVHGSDFRVVSRRAAGTPLRVRGIRVSLRASERSAEVRPRPPLLGFAEVREPRVSIVIPTRNGLEILRQCLRALRANTPPGYEVIVVDDGSSDGTCDALATVPGLRLIRLAGNVGFSLACNAGARPARAPLVLFLNNDTVPLSGWLEPMLAALERSPRVDVVGSRLLYPRVGLVQHAGIDLRADGLPYSRLRFEPSDAPEVNEDRILPAVTGACLLIRRRLFEKLGGFDEEFRNGYEDVDLCLRAREAGFLSFYCSASILLHYESVSEGRLDSESANVEIFLRRWGSRASAPLTMAPSAAG